MVWFFFCFRNPPVGPGTTAHILLSRLPYIGDKIVPNWEQLDYNIVIGLRLPGVCLGRVRKNSLCAEETYFLFNYN